MTPALYYVTYTGSDGQRHAAAILAEHDDGSVTIRRGYYDPPSGTRVRWSVADDVRPMGPDRRRAQDRRTDPGGWAGPWPDDEQENTGAEA